MLDTQSIKHDYKKFFMLPDDLLDIAKRYCWRVKWSERHAYPFATSLRVLETWKDDLLKKLAEAGVTNENLAEEMLWMDTEWQLFCVRALHFFEARTFQKTLPRLIAAGYAQQRYIKRDTNNQRVGDENGQPLVYSTYQDARRDKQHPGEIIHQVLFLSDAVNKDIAALSPTPPPPSPDVPPSPKTKKGDGAQGGNLVTSSPSEKGPTARGGNPDTARLSSDNISHPSQFCEGSRSLASQNSHYFGRNTAKKDEGGESGQNTPPTPRKNAQDLSQKCEEPAQKCEPPVGKNASNKNLNKEIREESNEESLISAEGAAGPFFDFDFSQHFGPNAILQLATRLMPLKEEYKTESRRQTALLSTEQTAEKLAQNDLLRERGLRHLARLLSYLADPNSPCKWRSYIRQQNPGFQPRLWHLNDKVVQLASREMEACDWWPEGLLETPSTRPAPESVGDAADVVDMADLAGIAPEIRQGMDLKTARNLIAYVRELLQGIPRLFVDSFRVDQSGRDRSRGYFVDFCCEESPMLRLYSLADWDLVAEHAAYLNEPDFVQRLAEALRKVSIA